MKIYFAAPLFNNAEKRFNKELTKKLESLGFEVFLPQRDGVESSKLPYNKISKEKVRKAMFELDRDEILKSDIFLFILDGRVPDEGACVELGIAYSQRYFKKSNKLLVGLHTDTRSAFIATKLNPILKIPLDHISKNEKDLIQYLETYKLLIDNKK